MELRVLQYFLAVAREQSISAAAESLHLSQPTLSRQLKELEEELGKQLMVRGSRRITLTEEGMLLRKRAEEIIDLVHKTESEIIDSDETITGDICIGSGETDGIRLLARAARALHDQYPQIQYHIASGDGPLVTEQLDKGLIDFGVLIGRPDLSKYDALPLPARDVWGVLMPAGCPLAQKAAVAPEDLWDKPLIVSRQRGRRPDPLAAPQPQPAEHCGHLQPDLQCLAAGGRGAGLRPDAGQAGEHHRQPAVFPSADAGAGHWDVSGMEKIPGLFQSRREVFGSAAKPAGVCRRGAGRVRSRPAVSRFHFPGNLSRRRARPPRPGILTAGCVENWRILPPHPFVFGG